MEYSAKNGFIPQDEDHCLECGHFMGGEDNICGYIYDAIEEAIKEEGFELDVIFCPHFKEKSHEKKK